MERYGTGYLEERRLVKRWPGVIPALVSLVVTLALFFLTWWIFHDPRGIMRMYTPYVGYMYTRWWLIVMIWMVYLFNYWPFKRSWLEKDASGHQGSCAHRRFPWWCSTCSSRVFFEKLLGNYGLAYFKS